MAGVELEKVSRVVIAGNEQDDKFAAAMPNLNLYGDDLKEYRTMLLWLQNQVERGEPNEKTVNQCLEWLARATTSSSQHL